MRILHLHHDDYKIGQWSGGTTTELFIWPEGADYSKREFAFRVSSARVDLAESDFTPLPGVVRYITPLTGGFTLTHPSTQPVVMEPLDTPYRFSGETPTHCVGQATDFNLMLKGVAGEMTIRSGEMLCRSGFTCVYTLTPATVTADGRTIALRAGDLLVLQCQSPAPICLGPEPMIICQVDAH